MQVQKVQSNQTRFGTKVKMNPRFIDNVLKIGEYSRLREQISVLEKNGIDDILSINKIIIINEKSKPWTAFQKVFAEVYQIEGNKIFMGDAVESSVYEVGPRGGWHFPNIVNLYNKAKESVRDIHSGTQISKWVDYI